MRKVLLVALVMSFILGSVFAEGGQEKGAEETYVIKMSFSTTMEDQIGQVSTLFKERVEEYSGGRITVENYPMMQLGTEQENVQDVASGSLEGAIIYTGNYKPFAPSAGVLMLPYIFKDNTEAWNGMDSIVDELNERVVAESGTRIIGYFDRGFRYLTNSKRPVKTLQELQGLKIRVSKVDIAIETFKAWGVEPVPMAWSEVPTALQQKVIDGQENPYATIDSFKFYETQDYVTEIHYLIWTGPIIINNAFYESLSPELQDALNKAGKEAAQFGREFAMNSEEKSKQLVADKGMELCGPPVDEAVWQEKAQAIWPQFYDSVGGEEWVKEALALMGR